MPGPHLLVILRHAQSARNAAKAGKVFFNDADRIDELRTVPDHENPLTEAGLAQARAVGHGLRERFGTFDVVWHSGYRRTIETAASLLDAWPERDRAAITTGHHLLLRPFRGCRNTGA